MKRLLVAVAAASLLIAGCENAPDETTPQKDNGPTVTADDDDIVQRRHQMVAEQIAARGVEDEHVLDAMRTVPRHEYIPDQHRDLAYEDSPLPIGHDQTISQPYIVALMTELLDVSEDHQVFEVGTGSGYQAAVLAEIGATVYSIEIVCELAERAERDLQRTDYEDVAVKCGDGYAGWPEHAPFDRIIVTAAPPEIPDALIEQLNVGGKMVVPVGEQHRTQMLQVIEKTEDDEIEISTEMPVRFVPMVPGE